MSEGKEKKGYKELMQAVYFEPETIVKDEDLFDLYQQDRLNSIWTILGFYENDELTSAEIDAGISRSPCNTIPEITKTLENIAKLLPPLSSGHIHCVVSAIKFMNDPESKSMFEKRSRSKNAKHASKSSNNSPANRKQLYKRETLRLYDVGEYKNFTAAAKAIAPRLGEFPM